jgi:hypothetical protein
VISQREAESIVRRMLRSLGYNRRSIGVLPTIDPFDCAVDPFDMAGFTPVVGNEARGDHELSGLGVRHLARVARNLPGAWWEVQVNGSNLGDEAHCIVDYVDWSLDHGVYQPVKV